MTQPGETEGFSASEHVRRLIEQVGPDLFSHVLVNVERPRSRAVLARYESEGSIPVEPDLERIRALGIIPVEGDLISEEDVVRHDPEAVARALMRLLPPRAPPPGGPPRGGGPRAGGGGRPPPPPGAPPPPPVAPPPPPPRGPGPRRR